MFNSSKKTEPQKPIYFLYTRTLLEDYEFKNKFPDNLGAKEDSIKSAIRKAISSCDDYRTPYKDVNLQQKTDGYITLCCSFYDGRIDCVSRKIISYFGVIANDNINIDIEKLKSDLKNQINLMKTNGGNSFTMADNFPIIWDDKKRKEYPPKKI